MSPRPSAFRERELDFSSELSGAQYSSETSISWLPRLSPLALVESVLFIEFIYLLSSTDHYLL